jgi:pimeloyl-ACP methyl ester carboxylesterase
MTRGYTWPVILLPGGILPAQPAYQALLAELGDDVDARAKDLEMYADEAIPPPGYSLATEVEGIRRLADEAGFETFHLVGYSAGGASSLAFADRYPDRLRSLALMEPAWAGRTGQTPEEAAVFDRFRAIPELTPDGIMPAFVRTQLAPGVEPPAAPPGPPPPWIPSRLQGIGAFMGAFDAYEPDFEALRGFDRPVYYALGGRSNPDLYARMAERLAGVFPDFTLDVYENRHHFDPPHRVEPARLARALRRLWTRAEAGHGGGSGQTT